MIPNLFVGPELPPRDKRDWPFPYVIKCNHGSGMNIFVRGADVNWDEIESKIARWKASRQLDYTSEYWYQEIPQQVLVEPCIEPGTSLTDYRFFVFGGEVAFVMVSHELNGTRINDFVSPDFRRLDIRMDNPPGNVLPARPRNFDKMISMAEELGKGFDFVRVDLYDTPAGPLLGEMTFSPNAGYVRFSSPGLDADIGILWQRAKIGLQDHVEDPGSASALARKCSRRPQDSRA